MPESRNDKRSWVRGVPRELTRQETLRYGRHLIMSEVGPEGQKKLKASRVLLVGAGGLGSPLALYLAAAGVGTIGIVEDDSVDETNLQRQILHSTPDIGKPKLESARERLTALNPNVVVQSYNAHLTAQNALDLIGQFDVVADGSDNFPTRYLVNDACVLKGVPDVYGSVFRFEGQASVFAISGSPCYRCLYPEPPPPGLVPDCAEAGVLGVVPGIIGTIQANEVIKLLLGIGSPLAGRLLLFDALQMQFQEMELKKDPGCPVCGTNPTIRALIDYEEFCGMKRPTNVAERNEITVEELKQRLEDGNDIFLLDVREPFEYRIANLGGILMPMGDLAVRWRELDPDREIVVYCHTGARSGRATEFLKDRGFKSVKNLVGGIEAWSVRIDPSVPRY